MVYNLGITRLEEVRKYEESLFIKYSYNNNLACVSYGTCGFIGAIRDK